MESLRAPSDFLGLLTPLLAALTGDFAGGIESAGAAAAWVLRPLPADLTVFGFFAGFSFSGSELRFVPTPGRAPVQGQCANAQAHQVLQGLQIGTDQDPASACLLTRLFSS